jgi:hypothetical protein
MPANENNLQEKRGSDYTFSMSTGINTMHSNPIARSK